MKTLVTLNTAERMWNHLTTITSLMKLHKLTIHISHNHHTIMEAMKEVMAEVKEVMVDMKVAMEKDLTTSTHTT